jgi:hypothetical protein
MVKLKRGIQVWIKNSNLDLREPRVLLSSGSVLVEKNLSNIQRYFPDSFIPREPWREITAEEKSLIFDQDAPFEPGSCIAVIRFPEEVVSPFKPLRETLSKNLPRKAIQTLLGTPEMDFATERVIEYARQYGEPNGHVSIGVNSPDLVTVTYNPKDALRRHIGLHVDSWYREPLSRRHLSPNRMCLNLGIEDRYLLFINLPLQALFNMLEVAGSNDPRRFSASSDLGSAFMSCYDAYPIIRLRLAPNEAYLAPTENIVHDGSTFRNRHCCINLHMHGYFSYAS